MSAAKPGGSYGGTPEPPCWLIGNPTSTHAAQIGSSAGSKKNLPPGRRAGIIIPPSPCSLAQRMSSTARSMSSKDTSAWPARRPGVSAQKSASQRLYASRAWRFRSRSAARPASSNRRIWKGNPFGNRISATTP